MMKCNRQGSMSRRYTSIQRSKRDSIATVGEELVLFHLRAVGPTTRSTATRESISECALGTSTLGGKNRKVRLDGAYVLAAAKSDSSRKATKSGTPSRSHGLNLTLRTNGFRCLILRSDSAHNNMHLHKVHRLHPLHPLSFVVENGRCCNTTFVAKKSRAG